jgi:hypothetical protein
LYLLSAKATPPTIVGEVITTLEAGKHVNEKEVHTKVREARARARRERDEAKMSPDQRERSRAEREKLEQGLRAKELKSAQEREEAPGAIAKWIQQVGPEHATTLLKLREQYPSCLEKELWGQIAALERRNASS